MRCEACNVRLEGAQMDRGLCSECSITVYYAAQEEIRPREVDEDTVFFNREVEKAGLDVSWADGLGLKWSPEERVAHFHQKALAEYLERVQSGEGRYRAFRKATRSYGSNKRFDYGQSPLATEASGKKSLGIDRDNDLLGADVISYDYLWD